MSDLGHGIAAVTRARAERQARNPRARVAWPVVTRITSEPRWLFFRMAIGVTLVLWLPDLYILAKGQPPRAVAVLIVMHLAIAVVTYSCLVRIAPVKTNRAAGLPASGPGHYADRRA
jgi:hypothetical protein